MDDFNFATTLEAFFANFPAWVTALTSLVAGANAITMLTPTKADNIALARLLRILNILSMNIGKNRNADDV